MVSSLTINIQAYTHGALEDSRIGAMRRTLALWCIAVAQRLLRTRVDLSVRQ